MTHPDQEALLRLQDADTEGDQLRHRRSHLPAREAVAAAETSAVAAKQAHDALAAEVAELAARQAQLEKELGESEARATQIDAKMRSGDVVAARDIVRMGEEVDHLRTRAEHLEEQAMEVVVEQEDKEATLAELAAALAFAIDAVRSGRGDVAGAESEIDAALARLDADRAALVASIPADLVAQYERLRKRLGGVGAARLVGDQCTGCHLSLSPYDMDQIHRMTDDQILLCESCGRILVR
jgi:predicted  nucleic acid-binding Zn-ribbon protein